MNLRDRIAAKVHNILCGTDCGAGCITCPRAADVYVTASRTPYCWRCIDTWPADAPVQISPADLTVYPGHER